MRVLVLGGPRFSGRHIVETLVAAGDSVSAFTRGSSPDASGLEALGLTVTELPLYLPNGSPQAALMDISTARATAAGFTQTDARTTIADTRAWLRQCPMTPVLTQDRERDAITYARAHRLAR